MGDIPTRQHNEALLTSLFGDRDRTKAAAILVKLEAKMGDQMPVAHPKDIIDDWGDDVSENHESQGVIA